MSGSLSSSSPCAWVHCRVSHNNTLSEHLFCSGTWGLKDRPRTPHDRNIFEIFES